MTVPSILAVVAIVLDAVCLAWAGRRLIRDLGLARRLARGARDGGARRSGLAVLAGEVIALDERQPVRVVACQLDESSNFLPAWVTTGRDVAARPFDLRLGDGTRVRVDPAGALTLHADYHPIEQCGRQRVVRAELRGGDRVWAIGRLAIPVSAPAYRDPGPTLGPERRRPLALWTRTPTCGWRTSVAVLIEVLLAATATVVLAVVVPDGAGGLLALPLAIALCIRLHEHGRETRRRKHPETERVAPRLVA